MAFLRREDRNHTGGTDLLREDLPLVDLARRLHEEVGVRLVDRFGVGLGAGSEDELALLPARELVDGLFALERRHRGVNDLPPLEEDPAGVGAVLQHEHAGLPGDRHQLDDVGQRQLAKRSLKGHDPPVLRRLRLHPDRRGSKRSTAKKNRSRNAILN